MLLVGEGCGRVFNVTNAASGEGCSRVCNVTNAASGGGV